MSHLQEKFRVVLAQMNATVGDLNGNKARVLSFLEKAQPYHPDLIVFPELTLTGYPPEDLLLNKAFIAANLKTLEALAPQITHTYALVGYVDINEQGRLLDSVALLGEGKVLMRFAKRCLPNYGVFDEKRYFSEAQQSGVFKAGAFNVGVLICEDLWEPQPIQDLAQAGAQIILCPSASPYHQNKSLERRELFQQRARDNHCAVVYCNLVGGQDELVFDGASLVLSSKGAVLAQAKNLQEDILPVDIKAENVETKKSGVLFDDCVNIPVSDDKEPLVDRVVEALSPEAELYRALVLGLKDYIHKNGFKTVVLGVSGGIDSAVTACIAKDALGAEHVVGLVMPSEFSSNETQSDAVDLAKHLGIRHYQYAIQDLFEQYKKSVQSIAPHLALPDERANSGLAEQNIQARIRGNLLMALSNQYGWLVVTTGNKSEMATGYTTLYGDMAGGFAVIKDVPKLWVYRLAEYCNRNTEIIPQAIITRPPSAELAEDQKDQDSLPPYEVLDAVLAAHIEQHADVEDMEASGVASAEVLRKVVSMVNRAEYKRRQGPIGIKITPKAFGKDRRMPITNGWKHG